MLLLVALGIKVRAGEVTKISAACIAVEWTPAAIF